MWRTRQVCNILTRHYWAILKSNTFETFENVDIPYRKSGISLEKQYQRENKKKSFNVWFHISNACNLACSYCYIPKLNKAVDLKSIDKHLMSTSTIELATRSLFEFCVENDYTHLKIKFAGGEPTLNVDHIKHCCKISRKYSDIYNVFVSFSILTNAVFIDPEIFNVFKKYNFGVSISLDGDKDRHNEIRFMIPRSALENPGELKKIGSWETINGNIDNLISIGIKPFVLCTVSEKNYIYLVDLVKYCIAKKIGMRFSLVRDKSTFKKENLEAEMLFRLIAMYKWIGQNMPCDMPVEKFARFAEWKLHTKKQSYVDPAKVQWP